MGRRREDKMTNEAGERQKDAVVAIKRQQASVGSTLVTPLLLTGAGVPRRTRDGVKTGQNSVPPRLFKLPLEYFMQTPFMLWKKGASGSHKGDSFMSCSNSCKIADLIYRTSRSGAAYFSQRAFSFLLFCSIENILDPV